MENLNTMIDKMPIATINQQVSDFVQSAQGHENKIKLTFVLLHLISESIKSIQNIPLQDFISDVREKVGEIEKQATSVANEYHVHLDQNKEIEEALLNTNDNRLRDFQQQIEDLLTKYDDVIKELVKIREKLPIEKQIEQEQK